MTTTNHTDNSPTTSGIALLLRVFWMFVGPFALVLCGMSMAANRGESFSAVDIIFGVLVLLLIAARRLDITRFQGCTAYNEPATLSHWRRYALVLLVVTGVAWVGIRGIALFGS